MQEITDTTKILIADDQADVLKALHLLLKSEEYEITTASSIQEIIDAVESNVFDVVLMDLNYIRGETSGRQGLDLLKRIHRVGAVLSLLLRQCVTGPVTSFKNPGRMSDYYPSCEHKWNWAVPCAKAESCRRRLIISKIKAARC